MLSTIFSVSALLFSFALLCLGHGLQNTLIGVRATLENYPEWVMGIIMSGYFVGFILGTKLCSKLIPAIGQIRTFAVFASIASVISLLHVLFVNEYAWFFLRVIYGMCTSSLYMVIESWLNSLSSRRNRGQILSIYMTINFVSLAAGQMFIFTADPSEYVLFAIVSILISISLIPLVISQTKQPEIIKSEHFSFKQLYNISPLAIIGCSATGLTLGAFWGLGAVSFSTMGLSHQEVALIISISLIGACLFQWPLGYFSDKFDRRVVIASILLLSCLVCIRIILLVHFQIAGLSFGLMLSAFFFGGFSYTLYSLFTALANDFLEPKFLIKASGGLIAFHAFGAILGPIIAAIFMMIFGYTGLFSFIACVNGIMFMFALFQIKYGKEIPIATTANFVAIPKTGGAIFGLDPRKA